MVIDPQKLLPSSRINPSSLAKVDTTTSGELASSAKENKIIEVKKKLIQIDDILKGTLAIEKKKIDVQKKKDQDERRKGKEEKLELKPEEKKEKKKKNKLSAPSFLQSIIDFFKKIVFGYLAIKLFDHLPKLMPIVTGIMKFGEWFIDFAGKILNGLVTFIDAGYKAYDATRGFIKDKLGDGAVEKFDEFSGLLNKALNLALIVAMATSGNDLTKPKRDNKTGTSAGGQSGSQSGGSGAGRYSRSDARGNQIATKGRNYRNQLARIGTPNFKQTRPGTIKSKLQGAAAKLQTGTLLPKGATAQRNLFGAFMKSKAGLKTVSKFFKPILKRIPILGGLIDFALNYFVFKQPFERSALKAIGATIFGAIGAAVGSIVPVGGTFVGGVLGGLAGDMAGDLIYNSFFNKEKQEETPNIEVKSEGGPVSSEKIEDTSTNDSKLEIDKIRKINYAKQTLKVSDIKLSDDKSPFTKTVNSFNGIDFFGPILATSLKLISEDKISNSDYDSIGAGISNLFIQGVQENELSQDNLVNPQKFSKWAGKTFKKSVEDKTAIIKQSLDETKKKSKDKKESTQLGATDILARFIAGMSPGSTDGPGSAATERDSATGVPTGPSSFSAASYKDDPEFEKEVNRLAQKYDIDATDLLGLMASESGLNPQARNPNGGATGLIQFMPDTARALGTSTDEIYKMNRAQQMKLVEKYFDYWKLPKGATAGHLYTSVFLPAFTNKPADYTVAKRGGFSDSWGHHPASWYSGNAGLDFNNDGSITIAELGARIQKKKREFGIQAATVAQDSSPDLDFATMQTGGVVSRNMSRVETKTNSLMDYPSYGEETGTNIIVINKETVGSKNNNLPSKTRRKMTFIKGSENFSDVFDIYG